jgi:hypothetical protein
MDTVDRKLCEAVFAAAAVPEHYLLAISQTDNIHKVLQKLLDRRCTSSSTLYYVLVGN